MEKNNKEIKKCLSLINVMIVSLDRKGIITMVNKKAEEILGRSERELVGKNWFSTCIPGSMSKEVQTVFKKIAKGKIDFVEHFENPIINAKGEEKTISWFNTVLKNESGEFDGVLSSGQDVTDSRQAEVTLRKAQEKYELVLQTALDGFCLLDVGGNFLEVNNSFCDIIGYSKEELLNMNVVDIMNEDKVKEFNENIKEVLHNDFGKFESVSQRKDKKLINLLYTVKLLKDDVRYLSIFVRDITSEKESQKALEKSEGNYRKIFETAANFITSVDRSGVIVDCNNKVKSFLGYNKKEVIGQPMSKIIHKDYLAKANKSLEEIMEKGISYGKTYKMVKKDGSSVSVLINSSALKDERGEYEKTICIINDETEKEKAQKRIENLIRFPEENPNAVIRLDMKGRVIYANKSAKKDFFNNQEDFLKMNLPSVWNDYLEKAWGEELSTREEYTHSSTGKTYLLNFTPIKTEKYTNIYGIDISQRKQSEENLHRKIEELETFNRVTVNRELRMVELKKKISELEKKLAKKL